MQWYPGYIELKKFYLRKLDNLIKDEFNGIQDTLN